MKKEIKVIIPATEEIIIEQYCDICQVKTQKYHRGNCRICDRHLCSSCRQIVFYGDGEYDYSIYCNNCHNVEFVEYKDEKEALEERHFAEMAELESKIKNSCLKNITNPPQNERTD